MKLRVRRPPSPFRLLRERYFGEEARNPWVARNALKRLAPRLPADVAPVVSEAVESLIAYQDPDYALLYLDRIERYVGPAGIALPEIGELARLLSARMHFEDPIRIAQRRLAEAGGAAASPDPAAADRIERFRWDEIARMLPVAAAEIALDILPRLGLAGRHLTLHFGARSRLGLRWLRGLAALRITRPFSLRFRIERAWVERWLHMIDRSLLTQPDAAAEIVRTAALIEGHDDAYWDRMAQWHAIIDGLVKPVCDGTLPLPRLGEAVRTARHTAQAEPGPGPLAAVIARLRTQAPAGGAVLAAGE
jgi:hypothetical protein